MQSPFRILLCLASLFLLAVRATAQDNQIVYADVLENGWHNWSWGTSAVSQSATVHSGSAALGVTIQGVWDALWLAHYAFNPQLYQSLTFWINGGSAGGQNLLLYATLGGTGQSGYAIPALKANAWQQITVPLSTLGVAANAAFNGFYITSATSTPAFYIDDISLVGVTPPSSVPISLNASSILRTVDDRLYGVNLAIWDSALNTPASATLLGAMNTRIVRFPGGSDSDNYDWTTNTRVSDGTHWPNSTGVLAQITAAQTAQAFVTVNYGSGTPQEAAAWVAYFNGATSGTASLGVDSKGRNWQTVGYWASLRAAAPLATDDGYNLLRISHPSPFAFHYWELGNECYGSWEYDLHGKQGSGLTGTANDAVTYANAFAAFNQQMLAVDSSIHLGAVALPGEDSYPGSHAVTNPVTGVAHKGWTPVLLSTLHSLGVAPRFLIDHRYPQDSGDLTGDAGDECDATLLQASASGASDATNLRAQITDYLGAAAGAGVELAVTELNSTTDAPGKQSVSLVNALFLADSIGVLTQSEINACVWWNFRNGSITNANNSAWLYGWRPFGDFGLVASGDHSGTSLNTPYAPFYAATLLTHWARGGDQALATTTGYAGLTAYGARLASGNLALLVINKSPTANLTAQITTNGFSFGSPTGTFWQYGETNDLNSTGLATGTFGGVSNTFSYAFPAYSMTVLQLLGCPPPAVTATTSGSLYDGITLDGTIDPNGLATTYCFYYGLTAACGSTTGTQSAGSGTSAISGSATITGLSSATTYYYELVAVNTSGTTYGPVQTFTTTQALDFTTLNALISQSGNDVHVSIRSLAGYGYQLQQADSLSSTTGWQAIGDPQPGTNAVLTFVHSSGALLNKSFYRVQISQ